MPDCLVLPGQSIRQFQFDKDTFTFANELVWLYHPDPASGTMIISRNPQPPAYTHRCFVMVRATRQFFYHARFDAAAPAVGREVYRGLIRQIVRRSPRRPSADSQRVVFPGFDSLRAFSRAHEPLLKAECGQPWQSYFLRSHWRMIFPVRRWQQARMAERLRQAVLGKKTPTVHLFRFPRITINHGITLYSLAESERELKFEAYDPNLPAHPATLIYERQQRRFTFPPAIYWPGGPLSVIEIFRGGLY